MNSPSVEEVKRLADEYAHCYSFVGDPAMSEARAALHAAIDALAAQSAGHEPPLIPTPEMVDAGAQRLVSWEDNCTWPDSWSPLQVVAARNEAERVWRSMWLAASAANGAAAQPEPKP